ncbi:hypothetical protein JX265_001431 [Neoarthrinium moseri]|uniref:Uncharacterized protein n=1 Tax=Neoarthrinium moseri TaxID=1658444 RepID=A0A9P9WVG7_9PEZI|nr:hypothetical protein JX265_001431 [Neoarthrinium moseri]
MDSLPTGEPSLVVDIDKLSLEACRRVLKAQRLPNLSILSYEGIISRNEKDHESLCTRIRVLEESEAALRFRFVAMKEAEIKHNRRQNDDLAVRQAQIEELQMSQRKVAEEARQSSEAARTLITRAQDESNYLRNQLHERAQVIENLKAQVLYQQGEAEGLRAETMRHAAQMKQMRDQRVIEAEHRNIHMLREERRSARHATRMSRLKDMKRRLQNIAASFASQCSQHKRALLEEINRRPDNQRLAIDLQAMKDLKEDQEKMNDTLTELVEKFIREATYKFSPTEFMRKKGHTNHVCFRSGRR